MEHIQCALSQTQQVYRLAHEVSLKILKSRKPLIDSLQKLDSTLKIMCIDDQARHFYIQESGNLKSLHSILILLAENNNASYAKASEELQTRSYIQLANSYTHPDQFRKLLHELIRSIFRTSLRDEWKVSITSVTPIFEEFIRGITHFHDQNSSTDEIVAPYFRDGVPILGPGPVYHRLFSCGLGTDSFRRNFLSCQEKMSINDRTRVSNRVKTCYIERLIYEQIFKYMLNHFPSKGDCNRSQNHAHIDFLEKIKKDFNTCFPHLQIRVHVEWDSTIRLPISLTITREQNLKVTSQEIYNRLIMNPYNNEQFKKYDPIVSCMRLTEMGNKFSKVQDYETGEKPWIFIEKIPEIASSHAYFDH